MAKALVFILLSVFVSAMGIAMMFASPTPEGSVLAMLVSIGGIVGAFAATSDFMDHLLND